MAAGWVDLHESLLYRILAACPPRSRASAAAASKQAAHAARHPRLWRRLVFDDGRRPRADTLVQLLQTARARAGGVVELSLPSGPTARALENRARFAEAVHFNVPLPPPPALAPALAGVTKLTLDERASPVGGATDAFARALARGGGAASLASLSLSFEPWSDAADLFTDAGLAALAAGAGAALERVALDGATAVTDRGLAALGRHCPRLASFTWSGYSELVSDFGLVALASGARRLTVVALGRLPRAGDGGVAALAAACPGLTSITLPPGATDAALAALAAGGCAAALTHVDAAAAPRVTAAGVAALRAACPRLERVVVA